MVSYLREQQTEKNMSTKPLRFAVILLLMFASTAPAAHEHLEKWYQQQWCTENKGEQEIVLPDRTRADCITKSHAVEVEFGKKWAESIGQSLYYSLQTEKRAGIVLIIENTKDLRYWYRLNSVIMQSKLPIDTWAIGKGAPK